MHRVRPYRWDDLFELRRLMELSSWNKEEMENLDPTSYNIMSGLVSADEHNKLDMALFLRRSFEVISVVDPRRGVYNIRRLWKLQPYLAAEMRRLHGHFAHAWVKPEDALWAEALEKIGWKEQLWIPYQKEFDHG